jgi:hypothetical protein
MKSFLGLFMSHDGFNFLLKVGKSTARKTDNFQHFLQATKYQKPFKPKGNTGVFTFRNFFVWRSQKAKTTELA